MGESRKAFTEILFGLLVIGGPYAYSVLLKLEGTDVIDIQANDVDIQVYRNKDGEEVVQISSLNNNVQSHQHVVQDAKFLGCVEDISSDDCKSFDGTIVGDYCCGVTDTVGSPDLPSSPDIPSSPDWPNWD